MSYSSSNHPHRRAEREGLAQPHLDGVDGALLTTGLDNAVARSLQKTLDKLAENATTICITHHLGDLKTSDDVIYLDAGHIVEHGSFDELMKAKGTFYDQVNARGDE